MRRLVVIDPLQPIDGRLHLRLGDGSAIPLLWGDPSRLNSGWSASALYIGCDQLLWLSLAHEEGHQADWFLDGTGQYVGDQIWQLPAPLRVELIAHVRHLHAMAPGADRDHALAAYGQMHLQTRNTIARCHDAEDRRWAASKLEASPPPTTMTPRPGALTSAGRWTAADLARYRMLAGAWHQENDRLSLLAGQPASISLPLPYRPTHARLSIELNGTGVSQPLTVTVDGWAVGRTRIGREKLVGSRLNYWIPAEALSEADGMTIGLRSTTEPWIDVALTLDSVALDLGPAMPDLPDPIDDQALMTKFESLGDDCRFGFVQRRAGIEPLGLFRFAGTWQMRNMLRLLDTDLAGIGDPGSLRVKLTDAVLNRDPEPPLVVREFMMVDEANQFWYHTFRGPEHETEAEALAINEERLRYLKRKFLEDIEDGEKIWVLKDSTRGDINEAFAFSDVLCRRGPNRLLWVTHQVEGRPSGSVEWIAPNLLRGYADDLHSEPQVFDARMWLRLCRNAQRAFAEKDALAAASPASGG